MTSNRKRVLTGSRPTGSPHIGNYFGAYKPFIDLQDKYDFFFFLADFHALNANDPAEDLRENSFQLAATMLACGLEPDRGCFFAQSAVPEVNELTWILGCQAPYGMLTRAHSFKDAQAKGLEVNMGVFNYPILMAADILLYDADFVPVGQDQKQHLEMTRDFAGRFNHRYGDVLTVPEPLISEAVGVVPGTDGEKMSKSKNNYLSLFADDKTWKKQVMAIVTDAKSLDEPKNPETCNVYKLIQLIASAEEAEEIAAKYRKGGYGYGHAKQELLRQLQTRFGPMRPIYMDWVERKDDLRRLILDGSMRAREIAQDKLTQIQRAVGLIGRPH